MPDLPNPDTDPDDDDEIVSPVSPNRTELSGRKALAAAAWQAVASVRLHHRLNGSVARCIIIATPGADWIASIAKHLTGQYGRQFSIRGAGDGGRIGKKPEIDVAEMLETLGSGKGLIFVCHEPQSLPPALLAAADILVTVPSDSLPLVRQAIKAMTGTSARGLTQADIAGLTFSELGAALRAKATARQCIANLRRARAGTQPIAMTTGPGVGDLPLSASIKAWANETLAALEEVAAETAPPRLPPFVMLEGPPGTGKTLLAGALARSAGWAFVPTSVSSWFSTSDGHLGGVSTAMTGFFDDLLAQDRVVGFLDEIDAIPNRASLSPRDSQWWTPIITGLLLQIDRLQASGKRLMLVGATNFYDRLDAALVRPGRLEQRVTLLPPQNEAETRAVLAHYLADLLPAADLTLAARLGHGATPATIASWARAAKTRARAAQRPLALHDLIEQIAPPDTRHPDHIRATALHEAGHALVAMRLGLTVEQMSILPTPSRDGAIVTTPHPTPPTWQAVQTLVTVGMAGRAADTLLGAGPDTGAASDLANATRLLADAIGKWGLHDRLVVAAPSTVGGSSTDTDLARRIDWELKAGLHRALRMIEAERHLVETLAELLMDRRVLASDEIAGVIGTAGAKVRSNVAVRDDPKSLVVAGHRS